MINVFLIEDDQLVREAIRALLKNNSENIQVVGEAENGKKAMASIREKKPQLVLLDIHLPDMSGLEIANDLLHQYPGIKIIILTAATNNIFPLRLLAIGAQGYLTKGVSGKELISTIKEVFKGRKIISPHIAHHLCLINAKISPESVFNKLTTREMEVLLAMLRGLSTRQMTARFHLSSKTISTHRIAILKTVGAENEVELLWKALKEGIIDMK